MFSVSNYFRFDYDRKGRNGLKLVEVSRTSEPQSQICWGVNGCSVWEHDMDHYVVVDAPNKEEALEAACGYLTAFGRNILRRW